MINKTLVRRRVAESWLWTGLAFVLVLVVWAGITIFAMRFMGHRAVIGLYVPIVATMLLMFLIAEPLICLVLGAKRATTTEHPAFVGAVDELYATHKPWWVIKPRLYVLTRMDVPNAMAFGWGVLGQGAIGITQPLYEKLSHDQLKGVVAHELGHLMSRDVGLMSVVSILTSGVDAIRKVVWRGGSVFGRGPAAWLIAGILAIVSKVIFGFLRAAVSQERELAADALGAKYAGTGEHLAEALRILDRSRPTGSKRAEGPFDDLMISHPHPGDRINALRALELREPGLLTHDQKEV